MMVSDAMELKAVRSADAKGLCSLHSSWHSVGLCDDARLDSRGTFREVVCGEGECAGKIIVVFALCGDFNSIESYHCSAFNLVI